jgi:hypothetical protein
MKGVLKHGAAWALARWLVACGFRLELGRQHSVRRRARHDARAARRQRKRKADRWAMALYPVAVQNDLNPFKWF